MSDLTNVRTKDCVLQANSIVKFVSSLFGHTALSSHVNKVKKDPDREGQVSVKTVVMVASNSYSFRHVIVFLCPYKLLPWPSYVIW